LIFSENWGMESRRIALVDLLAGHLFPGSISGAPPRGNVAVGFEAWASTTAKRDTKGPSFHLSRSLCSVTIVGCNDTLGKRCARSAGVREQRRTRCASSWFGGCAKSHQRRQPDTRKKERGNYDWNFCSLSPFNERQPHPSESHTAIFFEARFIATSARGIRVGLVVVVAGLSCPQENRNATNGCC